MLGVSLFIRAGWCSDEFRVTPIVSAKQARPTVRACVRKPHLAAVIHSFAALTTDHARARLHGSVHLAQVDLHNFNCKQLVVGRFAIGMHLTCFLILDLRMTLVSQAGAVSRT
jgi:hypothetical protein